MAERRLPKTDVVIVGGGWTGLTAAYELAHAGQRCVVLERGHHRHDATSFGSPEEHDELKYALRYGHMQDVKKETLTFRNSRDQRALPMRRLGSFLPGTGLGGAGIHWNGQIWRPLPSDLEMRSHYEDRYGSQFIPDELSIQDWGVTYDELEPHLDFFEKICGAAGAAGNLRGERQVGGNPFEGPRSDGYPNPAMKQPISNTKFGRAAERMGLNPFPMPSANVTQAYENPYGAQLHPCTYCGFCERFGCGYFAKADPIICVYDRIKDHENFEIRFDAQVLRVTKSQDGQTATGVIYLDEDGVEVFQPADTVCLNAYSLWNVHLMLVSGLGTPYDPETRQGTVGRNYSYQTIAAVDAFFDETVQTDPFMGAGALGIVVDDFNGDNFDHSDLGFVGGGYIACKQYHGRPISYQPVPEGTPPWGAEWKAAVRENYTRHADLVIHGSSVSTPENYLDLDPTWTDAYGRPLLRMTFNFPDTDRRMSDYVMNRAVEIAQEMDNVTSVSSVNLAAEGKNYSIVPYQTTHNVGGAVIGTDPETSVVNRYGQMWDHHNVFVFGACLFPQNLGYNPTGPLMGLAYWTLEHMKRDYLPNPRPLMDA
ncbi:gluconate 2-dehydrogenase (plasmid) [Dinoroseobacter shibae DFL 12 = DSM 16493]|jgi:gluconate 2-dehydrogenase alpha chain|uniref:Gluconate 2-dehydrogenase n=1 Tax=Dinoroseobacter shibae (strain DSM 16493 / NCIMB 14021 / DFL 12) TaxID=398580 RepID=A8LTQ6_DINSH|nr:GMC family oxidoreductase [Dinoroseobacter shibae]ABV95623.1 gluconate 2-dehydrogenase [Dinoroseobacter shibae DFL 12 = DSM 16493]URF48831.1 GMC family oxidoreductase [Dinoroseobacter shibae]URF53143.1 GMC family oxidoreductase [Dinoroseobacter shibae]